jgi:hypothetical protein
VSEGDAGGGGTAGGVGGDEEAVWRDLIARYEMPVDAGATSVPWPDREDLPGRPADGTGTADSADSPDSAADSTGGDEADDGGDTTSEGSASDSTSSEAGDSGEDRSDAGGSGDRPGARGRNQGAPARPLPPDQVPGAGRTRVIRPATPPPPSPEPPAAPSGLASRPSRAGRGDGGQPSAEDDIGDHFIPPPPPPIPHLDPVAKGAWTALFGGPAYLFVSTLIGWKAPSWAALLAVAAFVGGFAVIVLRLGDRPSRGDGPDNGAVL